MKENESNIIEPLSEQEQRESSFSPEDGMYYERVFAPEKIRVMAIERGKKRTWEQAKQGDLKLILEDKNGQTLEVFGTRLVSRVLAYLQPACVIALGSSFSRVQ